MIKLFRDCPGRLPIIEDSGLRTQLANIRKENDQIQEHVLPLPSSHNLPPPQLVLGRSFTGRALLPSCLSKLVALAHVLPQAWGSNYTTLLPANAPMKAVSCRKLAPTTPVSWTPPQPLSPTTSGSPA